MDKLRAMQMFVRLADLGSFTKLAEQTNFSKSLISKEITRLESELGTRLLHRSTRKLQLTNAGEGYLQRVRKILANVDEADSFLQNLRQEPRGKLKINAPMALGITDLAKLFTDFMLEYPQIELDIHLGDESVDLVEQGFDLGFRASSVPLDSNYVGRPLINFRYRICASPDYLSSNPNIRLASDLKDHNCFVYGYFKNKNIWPLEDGVAINGSLRVNSTIFMMEPITRGLGIGFIPEFVCESAIQQREVVEILPHLERPYLTLYALYPTRHFVPPILVSCIEYLENWFNSKGNKHDNDQVS